MGEMSVMVGYGKAEWLKEVFLPPVEITPGDTKCIWNKDNPDEVEAAKLMFDKLIVRGYQAFRAEGKNGEKGAKMMNWDPAAERIILLPKIREAPMATVQTLAEYHQANNTWTGTSSSATTIWPIWNQTYSTTSTAITTDMTWTSWYHLAGYYVAPPVPVALTPEQIAEERRVEEAAAAVRAEASRIARLEAQAAVLAKKAADDRAEALLQEHLSAEQKMQLANALYFTVISKDGKRRYQINRGRAGNIKLVDDRNRRIHEYCIHPVDQVPDADTMLAQKLLIEHDEAQFLKVANRS